MSTATITGPLVDPALGALANRDVVISLVSGSGNIAHHASGEIIGRWEVRTDDAGDFSVELPFNSDITQPSGTYYRATIGTGSRASVRLFELDPDRGVTDGESYAIGDSHVVVLTDDQVPPGFTPVNGAAATVEVGTVTTLPAGEDATVVNSGTEHAAVLDIGIPQGIAGPSTVWVDDDGLVHATLGDAPS